ncbi:MAG: hypothetical protein ACREJ0_07345, partial [Geminicoccaceae bacterium]
MAGHAAAPSRPRTGLTLVLAFLGLSLLCNLPVGLAEFRWSLLLTASLEIAVVFALLALVPGLRAGWSGRIAAAAAA